VRSLSNLGPDRVPAFPIRIQIGLCRGGTAMFSDSELIEEFAIFPTAERRRTALDRLMLAVLQDALATLQRGLTSKDREERDKLREVEQWIRSRDHDWLFSFENICCTLRIDASHLRSGLIEVKRRILDDRLGVRVKAALPRRLYTRRAYAGQDGGSSDTP
jgi:hypothetical protein